ncbi:LsmAD domain-containing protein [Elsinoe australis]|uniref:LsmAD domain-containing protein n=1 Tax=Elsinoe australis TaxID=40998 RepID=A0A4U7AKW6_9PEZI|nr:LsmAD domain-containing protein [Elsinoe australis]
MSPAKASDDARKQSTATEDGAASGKSTAPKAWTTGTNPITQRASPSSSVNGIANGHVQEQAKANGKGNQSADKHAHDRLMFLFSNFVGMDTVLTLKSGEQFAGVFSGATSQNNEPRYHLKMVRQLSQPASQQSNGTTPVQGLLVGEGEDHAMAFDVNDTVDLSVQRVHIGTAQNRAVNGSKFRTDVEISGNLDMRERVLQKWEPGPNDVDMSLGHEESLGSGSWDQFAANEKLYNVRSDYDEDMYTTSIDKSNPRYKQLAERAERLAREMEREGDTRKASAPADSGLDEEDKYSGVRRETPSLGKSGPNAYVPPSKRPVTNKPSVSGAPFDPAIISSQIARPESGSDARSAAIPSLEKQEKTKPSADGQAPAVSQSIKDAVAKSLATPPINGPASKPAAPKAATAADASAAAASKAAADNGANIMRNVTDAFKQFNQSEKLRIQQQQRQNQQQRATHARQEKSVKLNDLKKFSQNFKLHSRIPNDLVPILAKDQDKQKEIVQKAEDQVREREERRAQGLSTPPSATKATSSQTAQRGVQTAEAVTEAAPQMSTRTRSQQPGKGQTGPAQQTTRAPGNLNQRNQMPYRPGTNGAVPAPIPIPPAAPANQGDMGILSPASATSSKFNVKAMEFKPNPAASTFTPTGPGSEAPTSKRPSVVSPPPAASVATPVADFFTPASKKSKLADGEWASTTSNCFSTVKHLYGQSDEAKRSQYAANGGIPQGYRTAPVWDFALANEEKSYLDMFPKSAHQPPASPMHASQNGAMPHQHQLPLHLQNGAPQMGQTPPFYRGQPHPMGPQHMDDGRMPSYSSAGSVQPSPRMSQPPMAFNGQTHPQMAGYPYAMPANGMSPGMGVRPMPAGGQYMAPQGAPMGGHMMVQQPSNGPYMGHPGQQQMHMYPSPGPSHVQPHFAGHPGQPGMPAGYTGSPRAHPMSHQGSQQGHAPQPMFMMPGQGAPMMMMPQQGHQMGPMRYGQPQFQGQHPGNAYAMQQRAMSNGGYSQHMTPRQQHAMPHQGPMAAQMHPSASTNGEDGR